MPVKCGQNFHLFCQILKMWWLHHSFFCVGAYTSDSQDDAPLLSMLACVNLLLKEDTSLISDTCVAIFEWSIINFPGIYLSCADLENTDCSKSKLSTPPEWGSRLPLSKEAIDSSGDLRRRSEPGWSLLIVPLGLGLKEDPLRLRSDADWLKMRPIIGALCGWFICTRMPILTCTLSHTCCNFDFDNACHAAITACNVLQALVSHYHENLTWKLNV